MARDDTDASAQSEMEQLSEQIAVLKKDVSTITELLGEMGARRRDEASKQMRRSAAEMRAQGESAVHDAGEYLSDLEETARDTVRRQPATSIGLAVALGFLAGYVSGRK